ncbi:unnamed protein product, partial [Ranitomeya imitator]
VGDGCCSEQVRVVGSGLKTVAGSLSFSRADNAEPSRMAQRSLLGRSFSVTLSSLSALKVVRNPAVILTSLGIYVSYQNNRVGNCGSNKCWQQSYCCRQITSTFKNENLSECSCKQTRKDGGLSAWAFTLSPHWGTQDHGCYAAVH